MYIPLKQRVQRQILENAEVDVVTPKEGILTFSQGRTIYNVRFLPKIEAQNKYDIVTFISRFTPDDIIIEPISFMEKISRHSNSFKEFYANVAIRAIEDWAILYNRKKLYIVFDDNMLLQAFMDNKYRIFPARKSEVGTFKGIKKLPKGQK